MAPPGDPLDCFLALANANQKSLQELNHADARYMSNYRLMLAAIKATPSRLRFCPGAATNP